MKVVAIVGSPKKNSMTYQVVSRVLKEIQKQYGKIESVIIPLAESNIAMCRGCGQCFMNSSSCIQFDDDMKNIEREMLDADLIIMASPVYAHSITGTMKNFVDRISYWLHLMKLIGKYGVVISVSDSNGNNYVDEYLAKIMEFLGISVIAKLDYLNVVGWNENLINEQIKEIIYYLNNRGEIINYEVKNEIFKVYKKIYANEYERLKGMGIEEVEIPREILYWKNMGYFLCENFKEAYELHMR